MGPPILPLLLILCIGYRTGVVVSRKLLRNCFHTVACTRGRTGGCGKSTRVSLLLRPLRSIVTGLISAPRKSSSGHRKTYMVPRYCFSKHQHDVSSSRSGCCCRTSSSQTASCLRTKPGTNAPPPAPASDAGACHDHRRSGHCIGSLNTSAETGNVGEGLRIAHVSPHRCSAEAVELRVE